MADTNDKTYTPTPSFQEAYKAVIDYNKSITSITSSLLAVVIGYLVFGDYPISINNLLSPIILSISLFASLAGFGGAIPAIQNNRKSGRALVASNIGAGAMFLGILCIFFIKKDKMEKIEDVLKEVDRISISIDCDLAPENCREFRLENQDYKLHYKYDSFDVSVIYSLKSKNIISLRKSIEKRNILVIDKPVTKKKMRRKPTTNTCRCPCSLQMISCEEFIKIKHEVDSLSKHSSQ